MLDAALDRLAAARDLPWQPPPQDMAHAMRLPRAGAGRGSAATYARIRDEIMPFATGNTHPRFWGWVHGTGLPLALGAEIAAAAMNANCGGRDHGATHVEAAVIRWAAEVAGLPAGAFGILTTGTSQATVLALQAARVARFGPDLRQKGLAALPPVACYAAQGAHGCVAQALALLGHGSDALRHIPRGEGGAMERNALVARIAEDRAAGIVPLAVIGTAGAVNDGAFDDFAALGEFCRDQGMWLHADAAFGLWTRLAGPPWRDLAEGIGQADSLATDFHKWLGLPYATGACLLRDGAQLRDAFASRPDYLAQGEGLAGGETWFNDYGIDLSRGFSALKIWCAIEALGPDAFGAAITDNCRQAAALAALVQASPHLELAAPVISNICCFHPRSGDADAIAARLQLDGVAVFSTTRIGGRSCLRAAIVNHRTTDADLAAAIAAVERAVTEPAGA